MYPVFYETLRFRECQYILFRRVQSRIKRSDWVLERGECFALWRCTFRPWLGWRLVESVRSCDTSRTNVCAYENEILDTVPKSLILLNLHKPERGCVLPCKRIRFRVLQSAWSSVKVFYRSQFMCGRECTAFYMPEGAQLKFYAGVLSFHRQPFLLPSARFLHRSTWVFSRSGALSQVYLPMPSSRDQTSNRLRAINRGARTS